uniref:Uncharacterized protein n=1 Tax=Laticauda laticaudata TaxID=8630 RepID=A0A8C5RZD1_LATLA
IECLHTWKTLPLRVSWTIHHSQLATASSPRDNLPWPTCHRKSTQCTT